MRDQAKVIKIGHRFFCRFGKHGQVLTAWSLAGAEIYADSRVAESVIEALKAKGKKPQLLTVTLEVQS
ncbi:hypothetical protein [Photobacterium sanguinicancri]|uniref:hypothetical protein n=1 Tax=Photobacterium sanguinicancri TaxID=875932 RepID=UPI00248169CD|nr:hypothetical protein [Photobacterium sanguinicancri]